MRNAKQVPIPGTEPEVHSDINEAIDELCNAVDELERAQAKAKRAQAILLLRMENAEVARYDHTSANGNEYVAELDLPMPRVRLKLIGKRE